jgi:hypothetical protein
MKFFLANVFALVAMLAAMVHSIDLDPRGKISSQL